MSVDLRGIFDVVADEQTNKAMSELIRTLLAVLLLAGMFAGAWRAAGIVQDMSSCVDIRLIHGCDGICRHRASLGFLFCVEDEISFCCIARSHKTDSRIKTPDACFLKDTLEPEERALLTQCTLWKISAR